MRYRAYIKCTLRGYHGSSARFGIIYVHLVPIYIRFNRACRTNDGELYIYAVEELISVLFAANRPIYTRWVMKYHRNLLNMEDSHPGINQVLCNGALSIRRTDKNFSRSVVDLTLEQTINADAASRHTGIVVFNNYDSRKIMKI